MKDACRFRAVALAALAFAGGCAGHSASRAPSFGVSPGAGRGGTPPPLTIKVRSERVGSRYVYLTKRRKDGTPAYILRSDVNVAESAGEGTGKSDFTNPHIIFSEHGGKRLVADAPHAVILVKEKTLVMDGGVRAITGDGMMLHSDMLKYDEASDRLHGEGHVLVTTPRGERLTGDRIDANLHLSEMRITHDPT